MLDSLRFVPTLHERSSSTSPNSRFSSAAGVNSTCRALEGSWRV